MLKRTKRLTIKRVLKLIQLSYGTQVREVKKIKNEYFADRICGEIRKFTRADILKIEDDNFKMFGC